MAASATAAIHARAASGRMRMRHAPAPEITACTLTEGGRRAGGSGAGRGLRTTAAARVCVRAWSCPTRRAQSHRPSSPTAPTSQTRAASCTCADMPTHHRMRLPPSLARAGTAGSLRIEHCRVRVCRRSPSGPPITNPPGAARGHATAAWDAAFAAGGALRHIDWHDDEHGAQFPADRAVRQQRVDERHNLQRLAQACSNESINHRLAR